MIQNIRKLNTLLGLIIAAVLAVSLGFFIQYLLIKEAEERGKDIYFNFANEILTMNYSNIARLDNATLNSLATKYFIQISTAFYGQENQVLLIPEEQNPLNKPIEKAHLLRFQESDSIKYRKGDSEVGIISIDRIQDQLKLNGYIQQVNDRLYVSMSIDVHHVGSIQFQLMVIIFLVSAILITGLNMLSAPLFRRYDKAFKDLLNVCRNWAKFPIEESFKDRKILKNVFLEDMGGLSVLSNHLMTYNQKIEDFSVQHKSNGSLEGLLNRGAEDERSHEALSVFTPNPNQLNHFSLVMQPSNSKKIIMMYGKVKSDTLSESISAANIRHVAMAFAELIQHPSEILGKLNHYLFQIKEAIKVEMMVASFDRDHSTCELAFTGSNWTFLKSNDSKFSSNKWSLNPLLGESEHVFFDFEKYSLNEKSIWLIFPSSDESLDKYQVADFIGDSNKWKQSLSKSVDEWPNIMIWRDESESVEKTMIITLKNRHDELSKMSFNIEKFCNAHHLDDTTHLNINMCVEELFKNILSYAYSDSEEHAITIELTVDNHAVTIVVVDDGQPFDPSAFEAKTSPTSNKSVGLQLVRESMDSMSYKRLEHQNQLTIKKLL